MQRQQRGCLTAKMYSSKVTQVADVLTLPSFFKSNFNLLPFYLYYSDTLLVLVCILVNTLIIPNSMIILRSIPWVTNLKSITESPIQVIADLLDPTA